jgi:hypothetical protein
MIDIVPQILDQLSIRVIRDDRLSCTVESTDETRKSRPGAKLEDGSTFYQFICTLFEVR